MDRLRVWWRVAPAQGRMPEGGWLFPGLDPVDALNTRQLNTKDDHVFSPVSSQGAAP
jgi:hypothetical protein